MTSLSRQRGPAPRSYFRFAQLSLRAALLLVTFLCVVLAILVHRAREQRLAVARVLELGGSVVYDFQLDAAGKPLSAPRPLGWAWLRPIVGDDFFQTVVRVHLRPKSTTDADMPWIGKLHHARSLSLHGTSISDAGLAEIRSWRRLEYLGMAETQVTSRGLRHLATLPIDTLILERTPADDAALEALRDLPNLRTLNLNDTQVTGATLPELPRLQVLCLDRTPVDDRAIPRLSAYHGLSDLSLTGVRISGPGLAELRESLPACNIDCDALVFHSPLDDSAAAQNKWRQLAARAAMLDAAGRLKLLDLSGTQLTDMQLLDLHGLSQVEFIDLRNTRTTRSGIDALRRAIPKCEMRW